MASTLRFDNWENSNGDLIGTAANGYLGVPGTVLQVVSATSETLVATTSTSPVDTSLSATITPSSASSKILISVVGTGSGSGTNSFGSRFRIYRGGASGTALNSLVSLFTADNTSRIDVPVSTAFYDSPATTSPTTYTLCIYSSNVANLAEWDKIGQSNITLMEIAG